MNQHVRDSLITGYGHLEVSIELRGAARVERTLCASRTTDLPLCALPTIACPVAGVWGAGDALYRGRPDAAEHALAPAPAFDVHGHTGQDTAKRVANHLVHAV